MHQLSGLSIVLPSYNEVDNLDEAVVQARLAARRVASRHEIIIVDDGSTDGTGAAARRLAALDPRIRVVVHERNLGYGAALRSGIEAACEPWTFLTDADLQFDLGELELLACRTSSHELIVGRRVRRGDPLHRCLYAALWNALVRLIFDLRVHDVDCAFKLVRTEILQSLELESSGATISPELVVKAIAAGARVCEVEVGHRARRAGRQTGARPHVILRAVRELIALRGRGAKLAGHSATG